MNRRAAIQRFSLIFGGTLLGADSLLAKNIDWESIEADGPEKSIGLFSKAQIRLLNEVAETIIPTTDTPGAKAAKVGQFIALYVSDCLEPGDQQAFIEGLKKLDAACKAQTGKSFPKAAPEQRKTCLTALDDEQKAYMKSKKKEEPAHYFKTMKDLVVWGYFTSEIGCTQANRFVFLPGRYETIDYKKGDKAWASGW
jgi:Gluconate 2-dehydrogenase subunit 3